MMQKFQKSHFDVIFVSRNFLFKINIKLQLQKSLPYNRREQHELAKISWCYYVLFKWGLFSKDSTFSSLFEITWPFNGRSYISNVDCSTYCGQKSYVIWLECAEQVNISWRQKPIFFPEIWNLFDGGVFHKKAGGMWRRLYA